MFSREHRSPVADAPARSYPHASSRSASIDQLLADRAVGNGLTMRWSVDDASLTAAWGGPGLGA